MNRFYSFIAYLFFAWGACRMSSTYGSRWGFGPYGMPVTLLAEDGVHYLDGTVVPLQILSLAKSGMEAPLAGALLMNLVPLMIALVCTYIRLERTRRNFQRLREMDTSRWR